ncbi:MAG: hypothetical protein ACRC6O_12190 [Flavobacterium sp.]
MKVEISLFAIILTLMLLISCQEDTISNNNIMPEDFRFIVLDDANGSILKTENDIVDFFYFENGNKKNISDCKESACKNIRSFPVTAKYPVYFGTLEAAVQSGDSNIKTFYIKIENDTDTIYLDVEKLTKYNSTSKQLYKYNKVKFNGIEMEQDKTVLPWVYVLKK